MIKPPTVYNKQFCGSTAFFATYLCTPATGRGLRAWHIAPGCVGQHPEYKYAPMMRADPFMGGFANALKTGGGWGVSIPPLNGGVMLRRRQ